MFTGKKQGQPAVVFYDSGSSSYPLQVRHRPGTWLHRAFPDRTALAGRALLSSCPCAAKLSSPTFHPGPGVLHILLQQALPFIFRRPAQKTSPKKNTVTKKLLPYLLFKKVSTALEITAGRSLSSRIYNITPLNYYPVAGMFYCE